MGPLTVAAIAALLAAAGVGVSGAAAAGNQSVTNQNGSPHKYTGFLNDMFTGGGNSTTGASLGRWFKNTYGTDNSYINSMSDADLGAILEQYYQKQGGAFGSYRYDFDYNSALQDLANLSNIDLDSMPQALDYDAINKEAADAVARENAQINSIYDRNLALQTNAYRQNLRDNNQAYNDYARQILSNAYQKNSQLMSGLSNSLDRSRVSALEAGASAGLRLSNNINTLLSTQNKQAQQSLETATNLAGMMLNQRQAATGIRNSYNNTLSNDANNRANLISGNAERVTNYQNNLTNQYQNTYNNKMTSWENSNSRYATNPFYGSYMGYAQNNMYNKQGGNK